MTSPYAMYQYFLNVPDALTGHLLRVYTFREREEIAALEKETAERPHARAGAARAGRRRHHAWCTARRRRRPRSPRAPRCSAGATSPALPVSTLRAALEEAGLVTAPPDAPLAELFRLSGLVAGRGEARRVVAEGGAYLNNERVTAADEPVPAASLLHGRYLVLRRGKRTVAGVDVGAV